MAAAAHLAAGTEVRMSLRNDNAVGGERAAASGQLRGLGAVTVLVRGLEARGDPDPFAVQFHGLKEVRVVGAEPREHRRLRDAFPAHKPSLRFTSAAPRL